MSEQYFESLTFNTSTCGTIQVEKLRPELKQLLKQWIQDSLRPEGVEVYRDIILKVTVDEDMYFGTLYAGSLNKPFLIITGARTQEAGKKLWDMLQASYSWCQDVVKLKDHMPHAPFTADLILPGPFLTDIYVLDFMVQGLSGALSVGLSHALLFPETFCDD